MTWFVLEDRFCRDGRAGIDGAGLAPFAITVARGMATNAHDRVGTAGLSVRFGPTRAVRGEAAELAFGLPVRTEGEALGVHVAEGLSL